MEKLPYLDERLSDRERAEDLVSRMTLEEAASQMLYTAPAIERLGVPEFNWWNEALHGVARAGLATVFPQAIGLAATFDPETVKAVADVISTEARAKYNAFSEKGDRGIYKGLTFWSPNINIFRDPRWGRGQETFGEDPWLTSELGGAFVSGLQGDGPRIKAAACAKHFAVHSGPESIRHEFNAEVSQKDLWETYLPAFQKLVTESHVEGVMGAYNRTNGEPCCGSKTLLQDILRGQWGFDGYITSDCWAIKDFHTGHGVTKGPLESVALAIKNGCNLNCGNLYFQILVCIRAGLLTEEDVRRSAVRLMTTRMRLGQFDEKTPWDGLGYDDVDTPESRAFNEKVAERSLVLLKNEDGFLPLDPGFSGKVLVMGPTHRSTAALEGNYNGTAGKYVTVLEGLKEALPRAQITSADGCLMDQILDGELLNMNSHSDTRITEAVILAEKSDLVILCLGLDATVEGEEMSSRSGRPSYSRGGDKPGCVLPDSQRALLDAVLSTGKPTVVVTILGSAVDLPEEKGRAKAWLQAFYPGAQGGEAIARVLTGAVSPSGRLPVTFYHADDPMPEFTDYAMQGRTYRFLEHDPRYPFGYGLSYADFAYSDLKVPGAVSAGEDLKGCVTLKNLSGFPAEEVTEVYVKDLEASVRVPNVQLCAVVRTRLEAGETRTVEFTVPARWMQVVQEDGSRVTEAGRMRLYVGSSQPDPVSTGLVGRAPLSAEYEID